MNEFEKATGVAVMGITAGVGAGITGAEAVRQHYKDKPRRERAKRQAVKRQQAQAKSQTQNRQMAQEERSRLRNIPDQHLSKADQQLKADKIAEQNKVIRDNSPSRVKSMASKAMKVGRVFSPLGVVASIFTPTTVANAELTQADRLAEEAKRQRRD